MNTTIKEILHTKSYDNSGATALGTRDATVGPCQRKPLCFLLCFLKYFRRSKYQEKFMNVPRHACMYNVLVNEPTAMLEKSSKNSSEWTVPYTHCPKKLKCFILSNWVSTFSLGLLQ